MQVVYRVDVYVLNVSLAVILAVMACAKIINGYAQTGPIKIAAPAGIIVFFYLSNLYAVLMAALMYNWDLPFFMAFQILVIPTRGFFLMAPLNDYCRSTSLTLTVIYASYLLLNLENPTVNNAVLLILFFASWISFQVAIWWKRFSKKC
jgi:hypothetical protein